MHKASGATFGHVVSRRRRLANRDPQFQRGVALQRNCGAPSGAADLGAHFCLLHALQARPCGLACAACKASRARCWSWLGFLVSWHVVGKPAARKAAAVACGALHTQSGRPVAHVAQCNFACLGHAHRVCPSVLHVCGYPVIARLWVPSHAPEVSYSA